MTQRVIQHMTDKSKGVNLMAFRISPWCRLRQVFFYPLALGPSSFPMHDPMHYAGSYDTANNFLDQGKPWNNLCKQNVVEFSTMVTEYMPSSSSLTCRLWLGDCAQLFYMSSYCWRYVLLSWHPVC